MTPNDDQLRSSIAVFIVASSALEIAGWESWSPIVPERERGRDRPVRSNLPRLLRRHRVAVYAYGHPCQAVEAMVEVGQVSQNQSGIVLLVPPSSRDKSDEESKSWENPIVPVFSRNPRPKRISVYTATTGHLRRPSGGWDISTRT